MVISKGRDAEFVGGCDDWTMRVILMVRIIPTDTGKEKRNEDLSQWYPPRLRKNPMCDHVIWN